MQLFISNCFLFIYFFYLCDSFFLPHTYQNYKINNFRISNNYNKQLNMHCDYYIDKDLVIADHNNVIFSYINLEHDGCYYYFNLLLDEDEDDYPIERDKYIKEALTPGMQPITIYANHAFTKSLFEKKYKQLIENNLFSINKSWNDVNKILKVENRYKI